MRPKAKLRIFLDTNVIFSALYSSEGPSAILLERFLEGKLTIVISQQVLAEVVRTIKIKLPDALPSLQKLLISVPPEIVKNPTPEDVIHWAQVIDPEDAAILAAAVVAQPDYLITGDKHFFENPDIAHKSGLRIVTPAEFLSLTSPS